MLVVVDAREEHIQFGAEHVIRLGTDSLIVVTLARLVQSENAKSPMRVKPSGMVTLVKLRPTANAQLPMLVTPSSIKIDVISSQ